MAVSTKQPETSNPRPPSAMLVLWARKIGAGLGRPIVSVILAFITGAIVIIITWPDKTVDPFTNVFNAYTSLFTGSFGTLSNFSETLVTVTPLIFASLSVAIAFRAGLFNIGAAGQLAVGAMAADMVGLTFASWPGWILIPAMLIASILAGAIWGGIVGFLKAWRGAHEVVTTIMLNFVAFFGTDYLIDNPPFTAPNGITQTIALPPQAQLPFVATVSNQLFGTHINTFFYTADVSIFFALIALVIYWFIISRTTFGYEIRVIGQNPKAAQYAGIPIKRNIFLVMAIAGAFAGLAGSTHLMGQPGYELSATAFQGSPTGFDAIAVALLGQTTAVGVLLASLFLGGLRSGSTTMQAVAHVDPNLVLIIEALMLFFIAAQFLPVLQRIMPRWLGFSRRSTSEPALLVPPITGATSVDLPEDGDGNAQNEVELVDLDADPEKEV
jgi:ABC-type uncharacterized transport system permease subunit